MARKLFILGSSISYTLSPMIYNSLFRDEGIDAEYYVVDVDCFEKARTAIHNCRLSSECLGFNVTKPFKVLASREVDELASEARVIEAVNTVVRRSDGWLVGYNTDWYGVLEPLRRISGLSYGEVLVIGAGGAARAALYALRDSVERVHVVSRSGVSALELARWARSRLGVRVEGYKATPKLYYDLLPRVDLLINASPASSGSESPIPLKVLEERLSNDTTVFDMVYNPLKTMLLSIASRKGCRVVDGLWMLVYQATLNIKLWFGLDVDPHRLRLYALRGLGRG